jgi:hypothetical protein
MLVNQPLNAQQMGLVLTILGVKYYGVNLTLNIALLVLAIALRDEPDSFGRLD